MPRAGGKKVYLLWNRLHTQPREKSAGSEDRGAPGFERTWGSLKGYRAPSSAGHSQNAQGERCRGQRVWKDKKGQTRQVAGVSWDNGYSSVLGLRPCSFRGGTFSTDCVAVTKDCTVTQEDSLK